jgi:hypothetical protein
MTPCSSAASIFDFGIETVFTNPNRSMNCSWTNWTFSRSMCSRTWPMMSPILPPGRASDARGIKLRGQRTISVTETVTPGGP